MSNHVFGNVNGKKVLTIMDCKIKANEVWSYS